MAFKYFIDNFYRIRSLPFSTLKSMALNKFRKFGEYHMRKARVTTLMNFFPNRNFLKFLNMTELKHDRVTHFRNRQTPLFFWEDDELDEIIKIIKKIFPKFFENTIEEADKILNHFFDLLGSGQKNLGENINWNEDFKSGFVWDNKFYMDVQKIYLDDNSDVKVPWELSRFQHLVTLGIAYHYSSDEKYSQEFVSQVSDWIDKNPPMIGVNWTCTMDVAIRLSNWIFAFCLLRRSSLIDEDFFNKFFKSILEHFEFIVSNLEIRETLIGTKLYRLNSNHYMSNIVGLIYFTLMFPKVKKLAKWIDFATSELFREIIDQTNVDGVNYELSISYHRLVTEFSLCCVILCTRNNIKVPNKVMKKVEKMIEFIGAYTKPDGSSPLLGDADDGRLHILCETDINDHRYLLCIGAILFNRSDFKKLSGGFSEAVLWLLGPKGLEKYESIQEHEFLMKSKAFENSGFFVMRENDLYMIVTCNDNGIQGTGSHGHNDVFSFEMCAFGETFITDSGTYVYSADINERNRFRSTQAHNTLMIDGEEINRIPKNEIFRLENDALPQVTRWMTNDSFDFFEGVHFGYRRLENPVTHKRQILFAKEKRYWVIRDLLEGNGIHDIRCSFHLFPKLSAIQLNNYTAIADNRCGKRILIYALADDWRIFIKNDYVSLSYGRKLESKTVEYSRHSQVPSTFSFILLPFEDNGYEIPFDEIEEWLSKIDRLQKDY